MPKFKVGDRVTMSAAGALKWGRNSHKSNNPWGIEGIVTRVGGVSLLPVMVSWDNGFVNSYREMDLYIIYDIFENE